MENQVEYSPVVEAVTNVDLLNSSQKRGRPMINIQWPQGQFTFESLRTQNVLSSSSLRKKMRVELQKGGLVKVDTLKTAFGRPRNVYEKV